MLSCIRKRTFCSRPDGIGTVTSLEREMFDEVKQRLHILLENEITHFRWVQCKVGSGAVCKIMFVKHSDVLREGMGRRNKDIRHFL